MNTGEKKYELGIENRYELNDAQFPQCINQHVAKRRCSKDSEAVDYKEVVINEIKIVHQEI